MACPGLYPLHIPLRLAGVVEIFRHNYMMTGYSFGLPFVIAGLTKLYITTKSASALEEALVAILVPDTAGNS